MNVTFSLVVFLSSTIYTKLDELTLALIIKEKLGISDRETVEQIKENPYLQYFTGLGEYRQEPPFDASMLVHFRQRININVVNKVNERVVKRSQESRLEGSQKSGIEVEKASEGKNRGKLIIDATCAPADITYPTDLKILNSAREKTESIIDILHRENQKPSKKNELAQNVGYDRYL